MKKKYQRAFKKALSMGMNEGRAHSFAQGFVNDHTHRYGRMRIKRFHALNKI
jgi:hypothetical protein